MEANTTREQSNKKRLEVGDPSMEQMEEREKNVRTAKATENSDMMENKIENKIKLATWNLFLGLNNKKDYVS